jgi:hypothetical protein
MVPGFSVTWALGKKLSIWLGKWDWTRKSLGLFSRPTMEMNP